MARNTPNNGDKKMFSKILFTPYIGRQVSSAPASLCERTGVDFPKRAKSRGCVFWTAGPPYLKGCPVYIWHQRLVSVLPQCPETSMERKMNFHTSLKNSIRLTLSSYHLGLVYPGKATKKGEGKVSKECTLWYPGRFSPSFPLTFLSSSPHPFSPFFFFSFFFQQKEKEVGAWLTARFIS